MAENVVHVTVLAGGAAAVPADCWAPLRAFAAAWKAALGEAIRAAFAAGVPR
jgi:hypothetical protein